MKTRSRVPGKDLPVTNAGRLDTATGAPASGPAALPDPAPEPPGRRPALRLRVLTLGGSVSRCAPLAFAETRARLMSGGLSGAVATRQRMRLKEFFQLPPLLLRRTAESLGKTNRCGLLARASVLFRRCQILSSIHFAMMV